MNKIFLALVTTICLTITIAAPVYAQTGITVTKSTTLPKFPLDLTFQVSARSNAPITDVRLQYKVKQLGFVDVTAEAFPTFTPSASVSAEWKWDMRRSGGLPPGTIIEYWWVIKDSAGETLKTPPGQVTFEDTRFKWQKLTQGLITVFWYEGGDTFAREIMTAAQDAASRLQQDTGAFLKEPVRLYIYASSQDLLGSMIFPQEWTGGVAFTRYGAISIGISSLNLTWGKRAIAHELTHLVTNQMTLNPYNELPVWLEEGIAMVNEGPLQSAFNQVLAQAISNNKLISLQTLASPFSSFAEQSYLSYAESYSVVDYLIRTYGKDKMFALLETFRQGSTYDGALNKVYGFDTQTLNSRWKQSVGVVSRTSRKLRLPLTLVGASFTLPFFTVTAFVLRRRVRRV
ncbi:MAG: peptidase MA family metallohydrolase [Dehalococcoidia bacterium]|nr:peptidase MA family metallohydrolase [Dehalococcoidia bacterium]